MTRCLVAAAFIMLGSPLNAAATVDLAPSSKWNVNYRDDFCRLSRAFGTGNESVVAMFDRFEPGQSFKLTLVGQRFKSVLPGRELNLRFGPDEAEQKRLFFTGDFGKDLPALIVRGALRVEGDDKQRRHPAPAGPRPPIAAERFAAVRALEIGSPLRAPLRLQTGSLAAANRALDTCIDDLLKTWGIDTERHRTLSRPATPTNSPQRWIVSEDYPEMARMRGAQGIVDFRLSVGTDGKPTACHIQQASRPADFDKAVCDAMMHRARFKPALDRDGQPLASFFRGTVNFVM